MGNGWVLALAAVVPAVAAVAGVVQIVARRTLWGLVRGVRAGAASRDPRVARRSGALLLLAAAYAAALLLLGRVGEPGTILIVLTVYVLGVALLGWVLPYPPEYRRSSRPTQPPAHPPRDPGAVFRRPEGR